MVNESFAVVAPGGRTMTQIPQNFENAITSWRLTSEQFSYTVGRFSWKVNHQKFDFVNPPHIFALPGISRQYGNSGKSDDAKTRRRHCHTINMVFGDFVKFWDLKNIFSHFWQLFR